MANREHVEILERGVEVWNQWRQEKPTIIPDLSEAETWQTEFSEADFHLANLRGFVFGKATLYNANLSGADLEDAVLHDWEPMEHGGSDLFGANLEHANLSGAELTETTLASTNLRGAKLLRATMKSADFTSSDLTGAILEGADLTEANFTSANLTNVNLTGAVLERARLVGTNLAGANITGCRVHGISAWNLNLEGTTQSNLVITHSGEPTIQLDSLEVAQFVYLLLNNERIRHVIDSISSKVVLILGRFTPERKAVLEAIRQELRVRDYLPVLFDFQKPRNRTEVETIATLAGMSRFVIADITDARSILQELQEIVPRNPSVPVQCLLSAKQEEPGMFAYFYRYPWVLEKVSYEDQESLIAALDEKIISPAELMASGRCRA
jgi:uncharacterized protein YjbI with pentapeptide repeats